MELTEEVDEPIMRLDLLVPTYNRAHMLHYCLESIKQAEIPNGLTVNLIVIDNNSIDGTKEVIKLAAKGSHIPVYYLFVQRAGKSAALNEALTDNDSDIIGMIDDDELLDKNWFNVVYNKFQIEPDLEFLGGPYLPACSTPFPKWMPRGYKAVIGIVERPREEYFGNFDGILMGGNIAIRRTTLEKVLPYPENIGRIGKRLISGEDEVIYKRLMSIGAKGKALPDMIIYHQIPPERLTRRYYYRWAFGNGISQGIQHKQTGIPRWKFRRAAEHSLRALFSMDSRLTLVEFLGTIQGRLLHY